MTCKYCQDDKKTLLAYSNTLDELTEVYITPENNLRLKTDDGFIEDEINYCPKCGRELSKE